MKFFTKTQRIIEQPIDQSLIISSAVELLDIEQKKILDLLQNLKDAFNNLIDVDDGNLFEKKIKQNLELTRQFIVVLDAFNTLTNKQDIIEQLTKELTTAFKNCKNNVNNIVEQKELRHLTQLTDIFLTTDTRIHTAVRNCKYRLGLDIISNENRILAMRNFQQHQEASSCNLL